MNPSSAKKPSIWPATPWMLSWPPTMMKPATLLRISTRLLIVTAFCTQLSRSAILK